MPVTTPSSSYTNTRMNFLFVVLGLIVSFMIHESEAIFSMPARLTSNLRWTKTSLVAFRGQTLVVEWAFGTNIPSSSTVSIILGHSTGGPNTTVVSGYSITQHARRRLVGDATIATSSIDETPTTTIAEQDTSTGSVQELLRNPPPHLGRDLLAVVSGTGSYQWNVPTGVLYAPSTTWWLTVQLDGGSASASEQNDRMMIQFEMPGTRVLAPLLSTGQDTDQLYGGSILDMVTRAYNFQKDDEVVYRMFISQTGAGCDVSIFFYHSDAYLRVIHGVTSQIVLLGTVRIQAAATGDAGEEVRFVYTLPPPAHLFLPPANHYVVGALWVNQSTVPRDPVTERANTPSGFPINTTARTHCYDHFGTFPNEFPSMGPLRVTIPVVPGAPSQVTWDQVLVPAMDELVLNLYQLSASAAGDALGNLYEIISTAVNNNGSMTWVPASTLPPGRYRLELSSSRYRVRAVTLSFRVADRASMYDVVISNPFKAPPSSQYTRVRTEPVHKTGDAVVVNWNTALRPGGVSGSAYFVVDLHDSIGGGLLTTVAASVSTSIPGSGSYTWTVPSVPGTYLPGQYHFRVRAATNQFQSAVSSSIYLGPADADVATVATSLRVEFENPLPGAEYYVGALESLNVTITLHTGGVALPADLTALSIRLMKGAAPLGNSTSKGPVRFSPSVETVVKTDIQLICLQVDLPLACYDFLQVKPAFVNGYSLTFSMPMPIGDTMLAPGDNYYFSVQSKNTARYGWMDIRSPVFHLRRHALGLVDAYNYWNSTNYGFPAAVRPGETVYINVSSTLPKGVNFDVILMNADMFYPPDEELASPSFSLPSFLTTIRGNHPGQGDCYNNTNGKCIDVVKFVMPSVKTSNMVYTIAIRNAIWGAYAWAYFYVGDSDAGSSTGLTIFKPNAGNAVFTVGQVMTVQWSTKGVAFSAPMKVELTDPQGFTVLQITNTVSNNAGTLKWTIPLSFCSDPVGVLGRACNVSTVRVRVAVSNNDVIWSLTSHKMNILPVPKYISVNDPVVATEWTANAQVLVKWTLSSVTESTLCSVQLIRSGYFTQQGDRIVANISLSIPCGEGEVSYTVPANLPRGWLYYVAVHAYTDPDSIWGRSAQFLIKATPLRTIIDVLNQLCPNGIPVPGVSARLCAATCADCTALNGVWITATTVALDFDVAPWYGTGDDLATFKAAMGAVRSSGVNLCWAPNFVGATRPVAQEYLPAGIATLIPTEYIPGAAIAPYLRIESGAMGTTNCAPSAMVCIPFTAAAAKPVTMAQAQTVATAVGASLAKLLGISISAVVVTVEDIALREATADGGSGSVPQVSRDAAGKTAIPYTRRLAATSTISSRRRKEITEKEDDTSDRNKNPFFNPFPFIRDVTLEESFAIPSTDSLVHKQTRRRLQEFALPPTSPAVSALISLQIRVTAATSALVTAIGDTIASAPSSSINGGEIVVSSVLGTPRVFTPASLSSINSSTADSTDLYVPDLVVAGATQSLSGENGLSGILSTNAYTDGTASFQSWLVNDRKEKPPAWALSPGAIAAIVICLLLAACVGTWTYLDHKYQLWFFVKRPEKKPKKEKRAPVPVVTVGPSIEDALSMHEDIVDMVGDKPIRQSSVGSHLGTPNKSVDGSATSPSVDQNGAIDRPFVPLSVQRRYTGPKSPGGGGSGGFGGNGGGSSNGLDIGVNGSGAVVGSPTPGGTRGFGNAFGASARFSDLVAADSNNNNNNTANFGATGGGWTASTPGNRLPGDNSPSSKGGMMSPTSPNGTNKMASKAKSKPRMVPSSASSNGASIIPASLTAGGGVVAGDM